MITFRKRNHDIPELNTSALPDLIFSVLFFFMIVTHMRNIPLILRYEVPNGKELQKAHKQNAIYICVDAKGQVQLGSDVIEASTLAKRLTSMRESISSDAQEEQQVIIRADRKAPMHVISQIKDQLRTANCLRVTFSASELSD